MWGRGTPDQYNNPKYITGITSRTTGKPIQFIKSKLIESQSSLFYKELKIEAKDYPDDDDDPEKIKEPNCESHSISFSTNHSKFGLDRLGLVHSSKALIFLQSISDQVLDKKVKIEGVEEPFMIKNRTVHSRNAPLLIDILSKTKRNINLGAYTLDVTLQRYIIQEQERSLG